jgi:hypothetical protein
MRLDDNIEYFKKFRGDLEVTAQILIAYHWRKKLERIRAARIVPVVEEKPPEPVDKKKVA